jgi:hypothetical protein
MLGINDAIIGPPLPKKKSKIEDSIYAPNDSDRKSLLKIWRA